MNLKWQARNKVKDLMDWKLRQNLLNPQYIKTVLHDKWDLLILKMLDYFLALVRWTNHRDQQITTTILKYSEKEKKTMEN